MRIVQLVSSAGYYGAENVCVELVAELLKREVLCRLVVFENLHTPNLEIVEVAREKELPVDVLPCRGRMDLSVGAALRSLILDQRIDIVHSHGFKPNAYSLLGRRRTAARGVTTCHNWISEGMKRKVYSFVDKRLLRRFDRVVAVSEEVRDEAARSGVPAERLSVIDNGVPLERFANVDPTVVDRIRSRLGVRADHRVVGTIGRLSPDKCVDLLLRAFRELLEARPATSLVVVGDGPSRPELEALAAELGIAGNVVWTGTRRDIPECLALFDLFAMTSSNEGQPMVLLEAMAARVPIVSTAVGSIPRLIRDGESGSLVAGEASAVSRAMISILDEPETAKRLADAAHAAVDRQFSSAAMAANYLDLYEGLMSSVQE